MPVREGASLYAMLGHFQNSCSHCLLTQRCPGTLTSLRLCHIDGGQTEATPSPEPWSVPSPEKDSRGAHGLMGETVTGGRPPCQPLFPHTLREHSGASAQPSVGSLGVNCNLFNQSPSSAASSRKPFLMASSGPFISLCPMSLSISA